MARLTMMFQVISGQSVERQGTRQYHPKKFVEVGARTNRYKHSFLARKIRDWNSLLNKIINEKTGEAFKKAVMC